MKELNGHRAIVCGASKGIGRAIAMELASAGADVILVARSETALTELLAKLDISAGQNHSYACVDMTNPGQLKKAIEKEVSASSPIHILINNSGGPEPGRLIDADLDELAKAFTMHVLSAQALSQLLVPGMKEAGYGRIVNIISTSVKEPISGLGVSNTIRGAMANWGKTLSIELAEKGITVNNILPGYTETDRLKEIIDMRSVTAGIQVETMEQRMKREVPANRFAEPRELGGLVRFLCSDAAGYINGANIPIDGGRTKSL